MLLDSSHGPQEGGLYGGNGSSGEVKMQRMEKRLQWDERCSSIAHEVDKKEYPMKREVMGYPTLPAALLDSTRHQRKDK